MSTALTPTESTEIEKGIVGFIGCGQMGRALLGSWLERGHLRRDQVMISAKRSAAETAARFGVKAATPAEVVKAADLIILAVKPAQAKSVLSGLAFSEKQVVISVMAGLSQAALHAAVRPARVVRTMPNTPAQVGAGVTLVLDGPEDLEADVARVARLFASVGHVERLDREALFHAGTALTGSGPAYMFVLMEAMADGAVVAGMPRDQARRLAAMTVAGAGALASSPTAHPAVLKDAVTSPAGTTAEGLAVLEDRGIRGAFIAAIRAAAGRSESLSGPERR